MLNGPKSSTNKDMQEAIASVLVAGLVVGTGTGSFLSLPIVKALWLLVYWLFFYKNLITSTKYNKSKRLCLCLQNYITPLIAVYSLLEISNVLHLRYKMYVQ